MSRFFLPALAGLLTLALTGPAHANGRSGGASYGTSHNYSSYKTSPSSNFNTTNSYSRYGTNYVSKYGTKFSHGYSFGARNFYWNSRCWSSRYGCYCYWCPYVNSWYYWCAPQSCYYPISYITTAPPVNVTNVNVAANTSIPSGPVGPDGPADSLPPAGPPVP